MNGFTQKQVTLVANTPQTVDFTSGVQILKVANMGIDTVAYKIDGVPTDVNDVTANILTEDKYSDTIHKARGFKSVSFISAGTPIVQWDTPESE